MPACRNGRRGRLKICCGQPRAGSSPAAGINILEKNRPLVGSFFTRVVRNSSSVFLVVTQIEGKENHMEQTNDRTFLETEPVGKLLLKLALPTVAAQLINMM